MAKVWAKENLNNKPNLQVKKLQTLWALGMLIVLEYLVLIVMMEKLTLLVHSKV